MPSSLLLLAMLFAVACVVTGLVFIARILREYRQDERFREYEAASGFGAYRLDPELAAQVARSAAVPRYGVE